MGVLLGVVVDFDERRGIGSVQDRSGRSYFFHCVQIADGSRSIEVGVPVAFVLADGHDARPEAHHLVQTN